MIFNCLVNLICILCVVVDCWVNCDQLGNCTTDCIESEVVNDYNLTDGTQDGKYGYELTSLSEEGQFFVIGVDEQDQVNLERSDIRDGQPGINLHLIVRLINSLTCEPMDGVYVHVWQANGLGVYSGMDYDHTPKVKRSIGGHNFDEFEGGGGPDFGGGDGHWGGGGFDNRGGGPFFDFIENDKFDHRGDGNPWDGKGQGGGMNSWQDNGPPDQRNQGGEGGKPDQMKGGPNDQHYPVERGPNDQRFPNDQGPSDGMIKPVDQQPPPVDQKDSDKPIVGPESDPVEAINQTIINPKLNDSALINSNNQTSNFDYVTTNLPDQLTNSTETIEIITNDENNFTISSIIEPDEYNVTTKLEDSSTTESTQLTQSFESTSDDPYSTVTVPESTDPPLPTEPNEKLDHHQHTDHHSFFKKFHRQKPINDDRFLRGYQATNHQGDASFITIIPGWYQFRSQHIHIEVCLDQWSTNVTYVGQLYLPTSDESLMNSLQLTKPYNQISFPITDHQDDLIFQQSNGNELILKLEPLGNDYQAIVTIGIDPTVTIKPFLD